MYRLMLVEDDDILRQNYTEFLEDEGFEVEAFADRHTFEAHIEQGLPDLVLLDISLGREREAGYDLCIDLRRRSSTLPIIFLTSYDSDSDKISGLRLGADDYLTKDVSMAFLVVRIQSLLKRTEARLQADTAPSEPQRVGELCLDVEDLSVSWRQTPVPLSLTHFWMVHALARYPGHLKTHEQLMDAAHIMVAPNTIASHIKSIRSQFKAIDPTFNCIETERSRGYRWVVKAA